MPIGGVKVPNGGAEVGSSKEMLGKAQADSERRTGGDLLGRIEAEARGGALAGGKAPAGGKVVPPPAAGPPVPGKTPRK